MLYELGRNGAGLENACRLKREDLDLLFFNLSYIFVDGFETCVESMENEINIMFYIIR